MPNLLNNLNEKASKYEGKRLSRLLIIIFGIFLLLGLSVGAIVGKYGKGDELPTKEDIVIRPSGSYEGTITFIEPFLHPDDGISYVLTDSSGGDIILLKSKDQKLVVSEGHYATVYGKVRETVSKEDYLLVDKVVIKNATN